MNHSESIKTIAGALLKAQAEIKVAVFDAQNPHFKNKYATLGAVFNACKPALWNNGIAMMQPIETDASGKTCVETILLHTSGEWISSTFALLIDKQNMQGMGSAITYARRYGIASMVGVISDEDDDANVASTPQSKPVQIPRAQPKPQVVQQPVRARAAVVAKPQPSAAQEFLDEQQTLACQACGSEALMVSKYDESQLYCKDCRATMPR